MELLKTEDRTVFDTSAVSRGFFIYGKHRSWKTGINGLFSHVSETEILVQFLPDIRNVTSHYRIQAEEVKRAEWELLISGDLQDMFEVKRNGTA